MWSDGTGTPPEPIPMPWDEAERRSLDEELVALLQANAAEDRHRRRH